MAGEPPALVDLHLHPESLSDQDLETMRLFGLAAALVPAHRPMLEATSRELIAQFDEIVEVQLPRLERAGIRAYAALGVDPRCIPRRGLSEVLSALPSYFQGGKVLALGVVGLHRAGEVEEEALVEQLALARKLKLLVLVHTPVSEKARITRRTLNVLRASRIAPSSVMVDHAHSRTVRLILECGHYAGLTIHPDETSGERATALVRRLGSERIVLDSGLGHGPGDILGLARTASLMARAGLSRRVIARVAFKNAAEFLRINLPSRSDRA